MFEGAKRRQVLGGVVRIEPVGRWELADEGSLGVTPEEHYLVSTRNGADLLAVLLMMVFVTSAVTLSLLPVVTNELRTELNFSDAQIGLLTSVFMGFYGLAGILSGVGAARWGGRLLGVSCAFFVVGSLVFALSCLLRRLPRGSGPPGGSGRDGHRHL